MLRISYLPFLKLSLNYGQSFASKAQPPELPPSVGRVAAAAAAFRFNPGGQNAPTSAPPPRPPPRKLSSYESGTEQPEHEDAQVASNGRPLSTTGKLVAQRVCLFIQIGLVWRRTDGAL